MKKKLAALIIMASITTGVGGAAVYHKDNINDDIDNITIAAENHEQVNDGQDILANNNEEVIAEDRNVVEGNESINNNINNDNMDEKSDIVKEEVIVDKPSDEENVQQQCKYIEKSQNTVSQTDNIVSNSNAPVQNLSQGTSDNFIAQVEQLIYNKVNEERSKNGVSPLSYNTTMEKYARIKSKDMGENNYFDHKDLNGNLITAKMQQDGVTYNAWGENIAYISGVSDANALAEQFMTNWMNSSGHRENILSSNFSSIGIGVYKVGNKVYATQEFYR